MIKILRLTDRVKLKVSGVTFYLAPLSNEKKIEISSCTTTVAGEMVTDLARAQHLYIKYSLKDIHGVETYSGDPYKLIFEGDNLTDDCVSEVFNLAQKEELMYIAWQILSGLPEKITGIDDKPVKRTALEVVQSVPPDE